MRLHLPHNGREAPPADLEEPLRNGEPWSGEHDARREGTCYP